MVVLIDECILDDGIAKPWCQSWSASSLLVGLEHTLESEDGVSTKEKLYMSSVNSVKS